MFSKALALSVVSVLSIVDSAQASDHLKNQASDNKIEIPDSQGNEFYRAIGKLFGDLICTAAFIKTSNSPDAKAYLLTNGHCAQDAFNYTSSNTVNLDYPVSYSTQFNYFHNSQGNTIPVTVNRVSYSTMKDIDLAILQTDKTIGQMMAFGLQPYPLAPSLPTSGEQIVISGIPINVGALQLSYCKQGYKVDVVEKNWHWNGVDNNNCQGISSGSSGSPVFNVNREVIGVINTTNVGSVGQTCYSGNPCEVGPRGALIEADLNYMIPTHQLQSCFDEEGDFNINNQNCSLPKPTAIRINDYPFIFSGRNSANKQWKFNLETTLSEIRVKKIQLNSLYDNCKNIAGYSDPIKVSSFHPKDEELPILAEGVHQYCIIPGDAKTANNPEVVQIIIDNTPPTLRPYVDISAFLEDLRINPIFMVPEYDDYYVAFGPLGNIDCSNAHYSHYRRLPFLTENVPTKMCVYGFDAAQNQSGIFEYSHTPTSTNSNVMTSPF